MDILSSTKKPRKVREASFWQAMKKHLPEGWAATRLESRATLGVPDVLMKDDQGFWHLVELKTTNTEYVNLSPHQVSFASRHSGSSCWIAVKDSEGVSLYHASQAVDLQLEGLLGVEPIAWLPKPVDWKKYFQTIALRLAGMR
ncbi:MAG: hypothetical protein RLZZ602_1325 [Pseudomonadota bacterium]|jgi:Holliday junction resolvase